MNPTSYYYTIWDLNDGQCWESRIVAYSTNEAIENSNPPAGDYLIAATAKFLPTDPGGYHQQFALVHWGPPANVRFIATPIIKEAL